MHIKRSSNIAKRLAEVPEQLKSFVSQIEECPTEKLPQVLQSFGDTWDRPRGDLCHWIPALNRFDTILEEYVKKYGLDQEYPQPIKMEPSDELLLTSVLDFTSFLLFNCSNRSIYSSEKSLAALINSISTPVVISTLSVCVRIAQRFAESRFGRSSLNSIVPNKIFKLANLLQNSALDVTANPDLTLRDFLDESREWPDRWSNLTLQYYVRPSNNINISHSAQPIATPTKPNFQPSATSNIPGSHSAPPHITPNKSHSKHHQNSHTPYEGLSVYSLGAEEVKELSLVQLVERLYQNLPKESWFDAVNKARVVKSMENSPQGLDQRRQLCKIQCLALTCAAFTFSENMWETRIQSKSPNLLRHLGDLVAPDSSNKIPGDIQVIVLETFDSLCHQHSRISEVIAALSANVSHGILMTLIRNTIKSLKAKETINEEFTEQLFSVVLQLSTAQSTGSMLVTAGLVPLLMEIVQLDSTEVGTLSSAMDLLDHIILEVPSTYTIFSQDHGIDAAIDIIRREVDYDLEPSNQGPAPDYCVVDYTLSYRRNQWLRVLLHFVSNVTSHSRTSERILNLVDSALLPISRKIISNPQVFGSRIISIMLQIVSSMLENEPTSFTAMHEAKVIDTIVDSIPVLVKSSSAFLSSVAKFIGALCHNEQGLQLVKSRDILALYFQETYQSILLKDGIKSLGTTFDSLTSEHPVLRTEMISQVIKLLDYLHTTILAVPKNLRSLYETDNVYADVEDEIEQSNDVIAVSNTISFLDGFLKNHLTRVEFIKQKGISRILDLYESPNIPYDFAYSSGSFILSSLLKSLFDLDIETDYVQDELLSRLKLYILRANTILDQHSEGSKLEELTRLSCMLHAIFQILFVRFGTGYRIMGVLTKIAKEKDITKNVIYQIGEIQRKCLWVDASLTESLDSSLREASKPLSVDSLPRTTFKSLYELEEFKRLKDLEVQFGRHDPTFRSVKVRRFLFSAIVMSTSKILAELATICTDERAMSSYKKVGLKAADVIARTLVENLQYQFRIDGVFQPRIESIESYSYLVNCLAVLQRVLFKLWHGTLSAQIGAFIFFKQKGGIDELLLILNHLLANIAHKEIRPDLPAEQVSLMSGAANVILILLKYMVSHKSTIGNSRMTSPLTDPNNMTSERELFELNQFLVECRIIVLNSLSKLWLSDTLLLQSLPICQAFLEIMTQLYIYDKDFHPLNPLSRLPILLSWENVCPSEDMVDVLVLRGVDESTARNALVSSNDSFPDAVAQLITEEHLTQDQSAELVVRSFPLGIGDMPISAETGQRLILTKDLIEMEDQINSLLISKAIDMVVVHPDTAFPLSSWLLKAFEIKSLSSSTVGAFKRRVTYDQVTKALVSSVMELDLSSNPTPSNEHVMLWSDGNDSIHPSNDDAATGLFHLLGLLMQDYGYFSRSIDDLLRAFEDFLSLLQHEEEITKSWYPHVLMVIETLLSQGDLPEPIKATFEDSAPKLDIKYNKKSIPPDLNIQAFSLFAMPFPLKDDITALAVARLCVHFSKQHFQAAMLFENGVIKNLFDCIPKFADSPHIDKLQTAIMISLRHCIETPQHIRKIISSEIQSWLGGAKSTDAEHIMMTNFHLVYRDPIIFIEVISELCTLATPRFPIKNRLLCLKKKYTTNSQKGSVGSSSKDTVLEQGNTEDQPNDQEDTPMADATGSISQENEIFKSDEAAEQSSGVIQLILSELISIKDEIFSCPEKDEQALSIFNAKEAAEVTADQKTKEYKASEHKNYFYALFLLQALSELLGAYNQCKLDFINFSKKSTSHINTTLFKPKSTALNFFLHDLLPTGTLNILQGNAYKEWVCISNLSINVIFCLVSSTIEISKSKDSDEVQNHSSLVLVRKVAIDSIIKAFRESGTNVSPAVDPLDWRYSKLANLAELCYRILASRNGFTQLDSSGVLNVDGSAIAKIMYDKSLANALTSALAEIDLNFPHTKRLIRLILRCLNKLSRLAMEISDDLDADTDKPLLEIETEEEDDGYREDTPDLFRNSTLGMFEVADDMYDDEEEIEDERYAEDQEADEMDYDEDVSDSPLSDVDDDEIPADDAISFDDEEFDNDSDEDSEDVSDDEMGVEIIVGSDEGTEDEDMDEDSGNEDVSDEEESSEWESYDDEDQDNLSDVEALLEEEQEDGADPLNSVLNHIRSRFESDEIPVEEDDDALYAVAPSGADDLDAYTTAEEEDDDSTDQADFPSGPMSLFSFNSGLSRVGGIRADRPMVFEGFGSRPRSEAVSNPLVSGQSQRSLQRPGIPGIIARFAGAANASSSTVRTPAIGDGDDLLILSNDDGDGRGRSALFTDLFSQLARGTLGGDQQRSEIDHREFTTPDLNFFMQRNPRQRVDDPISLSNRFSWLSTIPRWQETVLMFNFVNRGEFGARLVNGILNTIVPEAEEEERKNKEIKAAAEAAAEKERKEVLERKERQELEERERKEREESERREREEAEAAAAVAVETVVDDTATTESAETGNLSLTTSRDEDNNVEMHDSSVAAESGAGDESSEPRILVSIGGRDVDISGLGIDPTFLEALPDDMREEVFTQHLRELRSSGANTGPLVTEIQPEFLQALPQSIREELMAHDIDTSARNPDTETGGSANVPDDMDLATFLATLDPSLRQTLLLEQDDETLSALPDELAQEAHELRSHPTYRFFSTLGDLGDRRFASSHLAQNDEEEDTDEDGEVEVTRRSNRGQQKSNKKKVVSAASLNLVDRSGVASLVRLLYLPQSVGQRESLHELLLNICSNKQRRTDILNIILHILQDGSGDRYSVEKGYLQTTAKAKSVNNSTTSKSSDGTTPVKHATPVIMTPGKAGHSNVLSEDFSPVVVTQQVLEALEYLVRYSGYVKYFFITEHDYPGGFKKHLKVKGKGKEKEKEPTKDQKYPINALLSLLDRPVVYENNVTLELLSSVIQEITRTLEVILKKSEKSDKIEDVVEEEVIQNETSTRIETGSSSKADSGSNSKTHSVPPPPYIPESNLHLICGILTAKECTSRTFQQILAVMHHLSAISGVKDYFGKQLVEQAVIVKPLIIKDLKELLDLVRNASRGSDLQGASLAKFSSSSSDQAKLLRVLTAVDYLFDPTRDKSKQGKGKEKENGEENEGAQGDYLKSLYESLTFGPLWGALSDCLQLIQDRQDMVHVATALLPLIETLMVICKHSSVKDVQLRDHGGSVSGGLTKYEARKHNVGSEPLESLFFSFTDEHRKVLNQLVRNNPKLMIGSFSILVKNPKALEFDNKRRYFYRRIYPNNEHSKNVISLNVRREQVFLDSYKALYFKSAEEIKSARLNVRFQGEEGVDAGGVTREWFQVLSRQIFNPDYALFSPVASDRTTFHPNRTSWVNPEHLSFFKFIGRIIGKAIYDFRVLDCHFSRAVYKKILGKAVSIKDMETLDLDYYKSLLWMLENDITDIITETFSIEAEDYGEKKIIDLIPDGRNIPVTEENKQEYVRAVVDYRLLKSVEEQMDHFLMGKDNFKSAEQMYIDILTLGFHDIIPKEVVAIFDEQELELLISGLPDIDLDDWRNNTEYHNYAPSSPQIKWFWRAVRSFDAEERAKLLQFATGTSKVPLNGFKELEGMNGVSKFNIHRDYGSRERLPSSHTCFNQIDLPEYDSYETLRGSLLLAITEGREGFGFV